MLISKPQGQELYHNDVVILTTSYGTHPYIVAYSMPLTKFILYPLGGHSLPFETIESLHAHEDWGYLGNVGGPGCYGQLDVAGGIYNYLSQANQYLQGS